MSSKEWEPFGINRSKWWVWESKSETILEAGSVAVSNEDCMATYPIAVGSGESWVIAIMVHVAVKPGEMGEVVLRVTVGY